MFTTSADTPSTFDDWATTEANASLISTRSRSATVQPSRWRAWAMALAGCECRELSGPATWPLALITASQGRPCFSAQARLVTTTALAPSLSGAALPAVMLPAGSNAGRNRPRVSVVLSARTPSSVLTRSGSPFRCGTLIGVISSSNTSLAAAAAARWCDAAAIASCSRRV